jgi:hypothetical protein
MHPIQLTRDKISYHAAMIPSRTNYITAVAVLAAAPALRALAAGCVLGIALPLASLIVGTSSAA